MLPALPALVLPAIGALPPAPPALALPATPACPAAPALGAIGAVSEPPQPAMMKHSNQAGTQTERLRIVSECFVAIGSCIVSLKTRDARERVHQNVILKS
jgi:hypothetical protein